jgi:hypothetical protein
MVGRPAIGAGGLLAQPENSAAAIKTIPVAVRSLPLFIIIKMFGESWSHSSASATPKTNS